MYAHLAAFTALGFPARELRGGGGKRPPTQPLEECRLHLSSPTHPYREERSVGDNLLRDQLARDEEIIAAPDTALLSTAAAYFQQKTINMGKISDKSLVQEKD